MRTIRVIFTKKDEAAYISLLDLQRVMGRAMKRAGIPAWYSKGFNPHIYMSFAAPLALGHFSSCEAMDFKTESDITDWSSYITRLTECLPKGIDVLKMNDAVIKVEKIAFAEYEIKFKDENIVLFKQSCEKYNLLEKAEVEKHSKRGKKIVDLKLCLPTIMVEKSCANIKLPAGSVLNINPELLLEFLETLNGAKKQYALISRKSLLTDDGNIFE